MALLSITSFLLVQDHQNAFNQNESLSNVNANEENMIIL